MKFSLQLLQEIRANAVGIISLIVAVYSLSYNLALETKMEKNSNIRTAAFEVLKDLGELQVIVNYAYYRKNGQLGDPISGWGQIALITDMAQVLPPPAPVASQQLLQVWQTNWSHLKTEEKSTERISRQIDKTRNTVLGILRNLG